MHPHPMPTDLLERGHNPWVEWSARGAEVEGAKGYVVEVEEQVDEYEGCLAIQPVRRGEVTEHPIAGSKSELHADYVGCVMVGKDVLPDEWGEMARIEGLKGGESWDMVSNWPTKRRIFKAVHSP